MHTCTAYQLLFLRPVQKQEYTFSILNLQVKSITSLIQCLPNFYIVVSESSNMENLIGSSSKSRILLNVIFCWRFRV